MREKLCQGGVCFKANTSTQCSTFDFNEEFFMSVKRNFIFNT